MKSKTIIFVCSHNQQKILENFNIKPLLVGAEISKLDIYPYKDNIGDNISLKNPDYNELTGQYWVWKNLQNISFEKYKTQSCKETTNLTKNFVITGDKQKTLSSKEITSTEGYNLIAEDKQISLSNKEVNLSESYTHIGFFHYRRYLSLRNTLFPKKFLVNFPTLMNYIFGFDKKNIENLSQNFDIILPKKDTNVIIDKYIAKETTMKEHFIHWDSVEVAKEVEKVILEKFPEYQEALEISWNEKKSYFKNIFIMKKEYFNEYMNFMFSILFEFEKRNQDNKISSKERIYGFIAERLLNIYINKLILDKKNIRIMEFPLIRKYYLNIFSRSYFNNQLVKLKRRLNFNYVKYLFSKLIKKA